MAAFRANYYVVALIITILQLAGCGSTGKYSGGRDGPPNFAVDASRIPDAVPKAEPLSKGGNKSYVVRGKRHHVMKNAKNYRATGMASWYGKKFHGRKTSNGERYSLMGMTAAHKNLPIPSYVQVTNLQNKRKVIVRVNDRGPFVGNRIIDLSYVAAKKLGINGVGKVEIAVVGPGHKITPSAAPAKKPAPTQLASLDSKKSPLYLQMGVFAARANAEKIAQTLKKQIASPVQVKRIQRNNMLVYQVQVGPLKNSQHVQKLHEIVRAKGLGKPIPITKEG